jgi:transcriptional regulator with XRE-family HTH domain
MLNKGMEKKEFINVLGIHLRMLRKERNLTQTELANMIGKDRQSYQRVELGTTNPTIGYLLEIANGLNIPITDLFNFPERVKVKQ